jgi:hypothetical protein
LGDVLAGLELEGEALHQAQGRATVPIPDSLVNNQIADNNE